MSVKAGKRPLRSLSAHEKLEAIRRVHDGESKASVARDIGVPESTLRGWCKNEDKISYLSRQSSPETDESSPVAPLGFEGKEKKVKLHDVSSEQPYNLSMKASAISPEQVLNLPDSKTQITERERNRAELARLSVALGLNRPEMFLPTNMTNGNNISELSLISQYNQMLVNSQKNYQTVTSSTPPVKPHKLEKPTNPALDESVWYWLQSQTGNNSSSTNLNPSSTVSNSSYTIDSSNSDQSSSWFWKWYKQYANAYPLHHQQTPDDKPILYQQLMKDKDTANFVESSKIEEPTANNNAKARSVLDNLLNNNNNLSVNQKDVEPVKQNDVISSDEALIHGEKFLEWLESCSEPSVTTLQIMQFRYLLNNIKSGVDRKNNEMQQNRAKVKRK